jgi:hypothetical protein
MGSREKEHERRVGYSKPCIRVMVLYIVTPQVDGR